MPRLELTDGGVTVRMYRPGHGDCFLLALPREGGGDPVYVLIDCGYKPGSSLSDGPSRSRSLSGSGPTRSSWNSSSAWAWACFTPRARG